MELELTVVQPPTDLGFIAAFAITDQMIHIAGGTSARAPTLLASSNARHFERQRPPRDLGLRDVVVHGASVWVCGEYGQLAVSRDRGTTWRLFDTATEACLHALALAPDGSMWVVGDRGYAARIVADHLQRVDLATTVRFTAVRPTRDEVVMLGYDGSLRRWKAGAVTTAATGTAKPISALQVTKRGTWIVVGDGGFVARSPDGAWWTRVKTEADADLEAIALFGDKIVIVGDRGQILISSDDGRTWQVQPSELAVHLWAVAPFGDGLLIGGDDGLIAKLAPPGDRTWEDRVNVFGGAKALDLQFAAGPVGFVTKYLATVMNRDEPHAAHAEAFVRAYGMAPPPDVAAYYAAAVERLLADLHVDHDTLEPDARNLFESLVVRPGNGLIEAFCGAFRIGHADNGDSFHVELYDWDGPRQVVRYAGDAFSVVADSLDSLVYLAALRGAHRDDKISEDALQIGLRKLVGRTAPTLDPKRRDTEFLFFRSRWISALLQNRLGEVAQLFNADFNQIVPADQLAARYDACERYIPTALYSTWRAYLFDEPELARYLEIGRRHKARLVRDAVTLIDELRAGRKQLGSIADIQAHLAAFRALDLDPRRAEARKREADERAAAEARAKALANEELDATEPTRWNELAWRWLNNGVAHRQLLARLDATAPTAAQLAELDELRGDSAYGKRLGLVRIAEELSAELEAVLVGSLVRDDTLADALAPVAARSEDDEAPGWAAIDRALAPIYKGADPHAHFGTVLPYSLGGSDPIQGISVYLREDPVPHFHFVTYGFSDLMRKETDDPEVSGFGFELTLRLARSPSDEKVPDWAVQMLENLGRYVFRTGNRFAAGHKMSLGAPLTQLADTALVALVFTDDPELGEINSQFGKARFVQVVGITDDEYKLIEEWSVTGLVELLRRRLPVLVTDVARRSVLADAATSIVVKKRVAIEGSDESSIYSDHLQLATGEGLRVEIGALAAQVLPRAIRGRIRHGRTYTICGPEGVKLHLGPATAAARLTVAEREVTFELTPALATAVEDKLRGGLVGDYRFDHGLRVIVRPSFVTESTGLAREVHGIADPDEAKRLIAEHNANLAALARAVETVGDDEEGDADDDEPPEPDDDDADPPPSPVRVKKALAMTTRALGLAPHDGDVQFTHAMLLLDGDTAGLDTLDTLIAVVPSFEASVRINVATRMGRSEHPRFDEVVDAVLADVLPSKVVGERSFTVSATDAGAEYADVGDELFAELAEAILLHAPNRMAKLVPVLPANVTLLAKIAHDAIQADERDHALALYDRVLELPIPDEGEARINYLRSLNNACIQAHAVKAYDAAARIADRAQPFAHENPYIYHSAACAYAAVGDLAKAFHQVKLAVAHDYEHLAKVENDRDLGHLLEWPEFQALFRDWHARQEGN
ncbi:MAG: suppressor of fused domain protein [Deltaproteobacteria bacterium]